MSGTYRAAVIEKPGDQFVVKDLPHRELQPHEVLVKVEACGCCHSDSFTVLGQWPSVSYPRGRVAAPFRLLAVM